MTDIRALTVRQPWAWAIAHGGKNIENRKKRKREPVTCREVVVDGEPVLVRGQGDLTQADIDALNEVVRAAKRKHEAEHGS